MSWTWVDVREIRHFEKHRYPLAKSFNSQKAERLAALLFVCCGPRWMSDAKVPLNKVRKATFCDKANRMPLELPANRNCTDLEQHLVQQEERGPLKRCCHPGETEESMYSDLSHSTNLFHEFHEKPLSMVK
jgi:hypothetical protein